MAAFPAPNPPKGKPQPKKKAQPKPAPQRPTKGKKKEGKGACMFSEGSLRIPGGIAFTGSATPLANKWRRDYITSTTTGNFSIHAFTLTGESTTVGLHITRDGTTITTGVNNMIFRPTNSKIGGYAGRPARMEVSLVCNTPLLNRGGAFYYAVVDERLALPGNVTAASWTQANVDDLANWIRASPLFTRSDLSHFGELKSLYATPSNHSVYQEFRPYAEFDSTDVFVSRLFEAPDYTEAVRPMSAVWILVDATADVQQYSLSVRATQWLRFPPSDPMSVLARKVPTSSAAEYNRQCERASHEGRIWHKAPSALPR